MVQGLEASKNLSSIETIQLGDGPPARLLGYERRIPEQNEGSGFQRPRGLFFSQSYPVFLNVPSVQPHRQDRQAICPHVILSSLSAPERLQVLEVRDLGKRVKGLAQGTWTSKWFLTP